MTETRTTERPRAKRRPLRKIDAAMRRRIEAAIERMIETLDALDAPVEDREPEEEGDGGGYGTVDDEPSLGAAESINQVRSWSGDQNPDKLDYEGGDGGRDCDLEPSLGASEQHDQIAAWVPFNNPRDDREEENEHGDGDTGGCVDDEPSLGSLDGRVSQVNWSQPDRSVWWPNQDLEYDEADLEGDET